MSTLTHYMVSCMEIGGQTTHVYVCMQQDNPAAYIDCLAGTNVKKGSKRHGVYYKSNTNYAI